MAVNSITQVTLLLSIYKSPLLCYGRFGSHLCEKQERNVVKKYVLLKQRRTGKICANLLPQKSKQFVTKWQWLNSTRKCGNFSPRVLFVRYTLILQLDSLFCMFTLVSKPTRFKMFQIRCQINSNTQSQIMNF